MTVRNLESALRPKSVALFGASDRPGSVGSVVLRNILGGGFAGRVWPVNPRHESVGGLRCYRDAQSLPDAPDIAVIMTPAEAVPAVISDLGVAGCKVAVVITSGLTGSNGSSQAMLDAAKPHMLRVIGPNTVGILVPEVSLNASFAHMSASRGRLALLSQSGAIVTTMLDWAAERGIGFSQVVSLGDMADVDVSDYLDLLALDRGTGAILMYLESIPQARKFLSAARIASRLKPVIAIKAGRSPQAATAAATHTGALSGADAVVDAALRRAGVLRVTGLGEMFDAVETVARFRPIDRARLGIVTNGGGAGVLAVDRLMEGKGELATLAKETVYELDQVLPATWSHANPVDIIGDAPARRYVAALQAVADDPGVDVLLAMNCPTALASPSDAAAAVAAMTTKGTINRKPLVACWLGGGNARRALGVLRDAGAACFATPASAAAAVMHLTDWGRAQAAMLRVPDRAVEAELAATPRDARERTSRILEGVASENREMLTEPEAKAVLRAYGLNVPEIVEAATPDEVQAAAEDMLDRTDRLVVKLVSAELTHKSDVGGVVLNIRSADRAKRAAEEIIYKVQSVGREHDLGGFSVQPMISKSGAHELILGLSQDPVFGPTILFGAGGTAVEVVRDTAVALPPLDAGLAGDLIERTRIGGLLAGYRSQEPVDAIALRHAIIAISHLTEDFPCLQDIDINPLLAGPEGAVVLDARMRIIPGSVGRRGPNPDMAIRPYPADWRREIATGRGARVLRPMRPADALLYPKFLELLDPRDIRLRFMAPRTHFPEEMALRLTQLDYEREIAFAAIEPGGELSGVVRMACEPDRGRGEYALIVRSDMQGQGIGSALMQLLIDYARAEGVGELNGYILRENKGMLSLVRKFGFKNRIDPEDGSVMISELEL